jgi:hypothetical protein
MWSGKTAGDLEEMHTVIKRGEIILKMTSEAKFTTE